MHRQDDSLSWWWTSRAGLLSAVVAVVACGLMAAFVIILLLSKSLTHLWPWDLRNPKAQLLDIIKIGLTVAGGIGAGIALVVAYRRQRSSERDEMRSGRAERRDIDRWWLDRFEAAANQLASGNAAGRLVGVYRIAALADVSPDVERGQCIDILCSYLRMDYDPETTPPGERLVRQSILLSIRSRLRVKDSAWSAHDFDFTGAVFDGGSLSKAHFSSHEVRFVDCRFVKDEFRFAGAHFDGAMVRFSGAKFAGSDIRFDGASFSRGQVSFRDAVFAAEVRFPNIEVKQTATIGFENAEFRSGEVRFDGARFQGGVVTFQGERTSLLGGKLNFANARVVGGKVIFDSLRIEKGALTFRGAELANTGLLSFRDVTLGPLGDIRFWGRVLPGGVLDFRELKRSDPDRVVWETASQLQIGQLHIANDSFAGGQVIFDASLEDSKPAWVTWVT